MRFSNVLYLVLIQQRKKICNSRMAFIHCAEKVTFHIPVILKLEFVSQVSKCKYFWQIHFSCILLSTLLLRYFYIQSYLLLQSALH